MKKSAKKEETINSGKPQKSKGLKIKGLKGGKALKDIPKPSLVDVRTTIEEFMTSLQCIFGATN